MTKKPAFALAFTFLISTLAYNPTDAFQKKTEREKTDEDFVAEECQKQFERSFSNFAARQVVEEQQTLSRAAVQVLDVEGSRNGGVSIRGWDQPDILIRACKLASADDDATVQAILKQLTISTEGGKVRIHEPEGGSDRRSSWTVQFSIFVPRDLAIEASVHNGGLSLSNLNGKVTGRSQNGGISVSKSGSTQSVIELHSQNGGLILQVPEGFNSGIDAETSAHSRLDCRLPECPQNRTESDREPKRVQLGGPSPVVHVSTRNGSLQIMSAK